MQICNGRLDQTPRLYWETFLYSTCRCQRWQELCTCFFASRELHACTCLQHPMSKPCISQEFEITSRRLELWGSDCKRMQKLPLPWQGLWLFAIMRAIWGVLRAFCDQFDSLKHHADTDLAGSQELIQNGHVQSSQHSIKQSPSEILHLPGEALIRWTRRKQTRQGQIRKDLLQPCCKIL